MVANHALNDDSALFPRFSPSIEGRPDEIKGELRQMFVGLPTKWLDPQSERTKSILIAAGADMLLPKDTSVGSGRGSATCAILARHRFAPLAVSCGDMLGGLGAGLAVGGLDSSRLWRVLGRPVDPLGSQALWGVFLGVLNVGLPCWL